jgi:predicted secreted protein
MVNSSQLIYGGSMMILLNPTGQTSAGVQPAAFSTSAKLTVNLTDREVSSKDSGDWSEYLMSKFNWTASSDSLANLSGVTGTTLSLKEVYTAYVAKCAIYMAFASVCGTSPSWAICSSKVKFTGCAFINSMSVNADDNAQATYTIGLRGTGTLSIA